MRILHYALGFPPYRSGGLTKFCCDLMAQQRREGHEVALLWPGRMPGGAVRIRRARPVAGVGSYELVNPLPVPYDEGIASVAAFMDPGSEAPYRALLGEFRPDVVHVHTLMGLHAALLSAARAQGVATVFTTHDFFPLCPRVTLFRHGGPCASAASCAECGVCNAGALGLGKIRLLQSGAYRAAKDLPPVRALRARHRSAHLQDVPSQDADPPTPVAPAGDYLALRAHFGRMLQHVDRIHYNSTVARDAYQRFLDLPSYEVVAISHADISDRRQRRTYGEGPLRLRYLGAQSAAKGYYVLREALDGLWATRRDFRLDVHFQPSEPAPYLHANPRYGYADLPKVFAATDALVVPSLWHETFGFTALEALSFGVPVVMSGTVGARDILAPGAGVVVDGMDAASLRSALEALTPQGLAAMNQAILSNQDIPTMARVSAALRQRVYRA